MKILYLATPLQVFENLLEVQVGFVQPLFECVQILCFLGQTELDSFVHELGNRAVSLRGSEAQRPVKVGIEVDGGSFLCRFHIINITI